MRTEVLPTAEPFSFDGGPAGILLLHGFTGNPHSLRRMGRWLAARGHAVSCPLYPGHGSPRWQDLASTRWQDWAGEAERALADLVGRSEAVVLAGLSGGGAMALHLAARHQDVVRAVAAINPYVVDRRIVVAGAARMILTSVRGTGNDIRKPGENEMAYERIPVRAVAELARFLRVVRSELAAVRQPLLVFRSSEDHVVPRGTTELVLDRTGSREKELVVLPNSYHVATMDHDAEVVFERTHRLAQRVVGAA